MLITKERFEAWKRAPENKSEILVYGETVDGDLSTAMSGETSELCAAIVSLIASFCDRSNISYAEFISRLGILLAKYDSFKRREGGER